MNWFERFMFRSIPVWFVGLLGIFAAAAAVAFANVAVYLSKDDTRGGSVGHAILAVADIRGLIRDINSANSYLRIGQDLFDGRDGFSFIYPAGSRPDAGYLLLGRYDGDETRSLVELWDLDAQKLIHVWRPPVDEINRRATNFESAEVDLARDKNKRRTLLRHSWVTDDGHLLVKGRTPLTRLDACSRIVWVNDQDLFHHAVEVDSEGTIWVPTRIEPTTMRHVRKSSFTDDAITGVSPDGKILFQRSVSDVLIRQGLERYVFGRDAYSDNPIHLNDIQPVEFDGPYWKKGDLFLSLRNNSMIALYRPSEDRIVWFKEGPWDHQHDVDILDDHRISVLDNNASQAFPIPWINGHSDVLIYDFATDTVSAPWSEALAALNFRTETEGLQTIRPNGEVMVEEQNHGRILSLDSDGELLWEYINRASDGYVYRTAWSRLLEPEQGARIATAIAAAQCPAEPAVVN